MGVSRAGPVGARMTCFALFSRHITGWKLVHSAWPWEKVPKIGMNGSLIGDHFMRRKAFGEAQYRAATAEELRQDAEDQAMSSF